MADGLPFLTKNKQKKHICTASWVGICYPLSPPYPPHTLYPYLCPKPLSVMSKAIIFDMDGTIINNMHYHLLAWERMVEELGHPIRGEALFAQLYGSNKGVIERIFGQHTFTAANIQDIGDRKEAYYRELYEPHIKLIDGLPAFLDSCRAANIPLALGTASNMPNIHFTLDTLNIRHYFSAIVSADDVQFGKPHPDTYLKAAALLGIEPANCTVFEDVPKGVEAAANAGMQAVVLTTTHPPQDFTQFSNIITFIKDYTELNNKFPA
jgi:beta-phosphoglucomutase